MTPSLQGMGRAAARGLVEQGQRAGGGEGSACNSVGLAASWCAPLPIDLASVPFLAVLVRFSHSSSIYNAPPPQTSPLPR